MAIGMKDVPSNRYAAADAVVCRDCYPQHGSHFTFPRHECVNGECNLCGETELEANVCKSNKVMFTVNRRVSWQKWLKLSGKSAPQKCQIHGSIQHALHELLTMLPSLKSHLFSATWNRNIFDNIWKNLLNGHVVQIFEELLPRRGAIGILGLNPNSNTCCDKLF